MFLSFRITVFIFFLLYTLPFSACNENGRINKSNIKNESNIMSADTATFGAGCFWCVEAIFERVNGVHDVISGYAGGTIDNPTYEQVCSGATGHAEVCQITFDSEIISFKELLEIFWKTHDPTTLNRQGADVGTQYRSVIFYHNDEQKKISEYYKTELNKAGIWNNPIVTEISPMPQFYTAENYHQDYYENNSNAGYCNFVITPKVKKFEEIFKDKLK